MRLYPAIDMKDGRCVRLRQGIFEEKTVYAEKPYKVAMEFEQAGARFLHLVDLDGALLGVGANDEALKKIVENVSIPVEIGGGIRTIQDIEQKLKIGAARVILGTKAVENPEFVKEAIARFGAEKIVVGIDAKDGMVAIKGWETISSIDTVSLALSMKDLGVKTIIYTDIAKDGMLSGPNIVQTAKLVEVSGLCIVASGGVSCMEDLEKLEKIGVEGAILGKAIYEKKVDLKAAAARFQ